MKKYSYKPVRNSIGAIFIWNNKLASKLNRQNRYINKKTTNHEYDIYYGRTIPPRQYLENNTNRPDISIHNKNKREIKVIKVGITNDFGILNTIHRKICKYTDFKNTMKRIEPEELRIHPYYCRSKGYI